MSRYLLLLLALFGLLALASRASAQEGARKPLQPMDVFKLEYADDPQISPDGKRIVYVRISWTS